PCAAVVPDLFADQSPAAAWRALDRGGLAERRLVFAGFAVDLESASAWDARPDWEGARRTLATRAGLRDALAGVRSILRGTGDDLSWVAFEADLLAESLLAPEPRLERVRDAVRSLVGRERSVVAREGESPVDRGLAELRDRDRHVCGVAVA